jgi:sulfopyruvate decarboxylase subunit alpha
VNRNTHGHRRARHDRKSLGRQAPSRRGTSQQVTNQRRPDRRNRGLSTRACTREPHETQVTWLSEDEGKVKTLSVDPTSPPLSVVQQLKAALAVAGVTMATSLPDNWIAPLMEEIDLDPSFTHLRVTRESESIGICAGAFFAGKRSVALMGGIGILASVCELATVAERHGIPVFVLTTLRGGGEDLQIYQEIQGRRLLPLLNTLDYPYQILNDESDIRRLPAWYEHSRIQKRPYFVFLTQDLLRAPSTNRYLGEAHAPA